MILSLSKKQIKIKSASGEAILVVRKKQTDSPLVKELPLMGKAVYRLNKVKELIKWRFRTT